MLIRTYETRDQAAILRLTVSTFEPFYENYFRTLMGEAVFAHQHGAWREDYKKQVAHLHDPQSGKHVAVCDVDGDLTGYVAWVVDPDRHHGEIDILAVSHTSRGQGTGRALCEHAFADMRAQGVEVVEIGTGDDPFHQPARALYESLGCTPLPAVVYFKEL
jgi:ribosomal protein S18 acetylase RimI-like enzyme